MQSSADTVSVKNLVFVGTVSTGHGSPLTLHTLSYHNCHSVPYGQWKLDGKQDVLNCTHVQYMYMYQHSVYTSPVLVYPSLRIINYKPLN